MGRRDRVRGGRHVVVGVAREVAFPEGASIAPARQTFADTGIDFRTLGPGDNSVSAFVFDENRSLTDKLAALAQHALSPLIEASSVRSAAGDSAFLGSWTDRDEGAAALRRVLEATRGARDQAQGSPGSVSFRPDGLEAEDLPFRVSTACRRPRPRLTTPWRSNC